MNKDTSIIDHAIDRYRDEGEIRTDSRKQATGTVLGVIALLASYFLPVTSSNDKVAVSAFALVGAVLVIVSVLSLIENLLEAGARSILANTELGQTVEQNTDNEPLVFGHKASPVALKTVFDELSVQLYYNNENPAALANFIEGQLADESVKVLIEEYNNTALKTRVAELLLLSKNVELELTKYEGVAEAEEMHQLESANLESFKFLEKIVNRITHEPSFDHETLKLG